MKCKIDDLAVFVAGRPENLGVLVRVIRPQKLAGRDWRVEVLSSAAAELDGCMIRLKPGMHGCARDSDLRPLRDSPDGLEQTGEAIAYEEATA